MKKIIVILFILLLSACDKDSTESVENKVEAKQTTEVNKTETEKQDKQTAEKEAVDDHHGHNHGPEGGEVKQTLEGLGYVKLDEPYATENTEKVVVYEFFGYLCGHCNSFEPQMSKWADNKPEYVEIIRVPLNFQQGWDVLQQGYLTASSMGIADETHAKLFAAIHKERKFFRTIEDLASWYADNSKVNKEEFLSTAQSFIIDSQQRKADKMGFIMKITGTPTIVINGKYKPTNNLKSREDVLKVMTILVEKEAKEMGLINP